MGTHVLKRVLLPHATRVIFSLSAFWTAIFTWAALQSWNSAFMEYPCLCQVWDSCLGPAVEVVWDSISCLWLYLSRYLTQLWEGAGSTCLTSSSAWWRKKGSCNLHCPTGPLTLLRPKRVWVCLLSKARLQCAELGPTAPLRVAGRGSVAVLACI